MLKALIFCLWIFQVAPLSASTAPNAPLSLTNAIYQTIERHPEIAVLDAQLKASEAQVRQSLAPSEPSLSIIYYDMDALFRINQSASTFYQLTQPLGFPGKAFAARSVLKENTRALYHQKMAKRLSVINAVRSAYFGLALAQKNLELNEAQKKSYERILEIAKHHYLSGTNSEVDLLNAQTMLYSNENELMDLQTNESSARATLNLLLGNPTDTPLDIEPLKMEKLRPFNKEKALQEMRERSPRIQAAVHSSLAAEKNLDVAWMSLLPDFQLYAGTAFYNNDTSSPYAGGSNLKHTFLAGFQMTIPIWGFFNEREHIRSALAQKAAAEAKFNSEIFHSQSEMETSLHTLDSLEAKLNNFERHLLPLAERAFAVATLEYSSRKINYIALNNAATACRTMKLSYYSALVKYFTTYYGLGALLGEDLLPPKNL